MPISVVCSCGRRVQAKDELAGKTVKCPGCGQPLKVQAEAAGFAAAPLAGPMGGMDMGQFGGMGGAALGGPQLGGYGMGLGGPALGGPGYGGPALGGPALGMPGMGPAGLGMPGWQQAPPRSKGGGNLALYLTIGIGGFVILLMLGLVVGMWIWGGDDVSVASTGTSPATTGTSTTAGTATTDKTDTTSTDPAQGGTAQTGTAQTGTAQTGAAAAGTGQTATAQPAVPEGGYALEIGKPLHIEGTLVTGSPFDWSSYKGKVVLVDFWASWCGPCIQELPNVKQVYTSWHDKGFEVVGISLDKTKAELDAFITQQQVPWPILFGTTPAEMYWDNPMAKRYGIDSIPAPILVNKEGNVVSTAARGETLGQLVKQLIDGGTAPAGIGESPLVAINRSLGEWRGKEPNPKGMRRFEERFILEAGFSWMVELLPYLGREDLYKRMDFSKSWMMWETADMQGIGHEVIPAFLNPGDNRQTVAPLFPPHLHGMALTHFVGMSGVENERTVVAAELSRDDPRAGVFGYDAVAKPEQITDGLSQTIMVIGNGKFVNPWISGGGCTIRGAREPYFDEITGFGSAGLAKPGAYVLMADGSAKIMSADVDPAVFAKLCTIHGADTVDLAPIEKQVFQEAPAP